MAGADRVEGCLFGNGERTGNVCLVTLGAEPLLAGHRSRPRFLRHRRDHPHRRVLQPICRCIRAIRTRGELVFTAFSGSHQDAIKKGLAAQRDAEAARRQRVWDVPYLPIDPADVGRTYEAVIRVNSQSGKGGIAYLLERDYGLALPRLLQIEFSQVDPADHRRDRQGAVRGRDSRRVRARIPARRRADRVCRSSRAAQRRRWRGRASDRAARRSTASKRVLTGAGNGPVDAFVHALRDGDRARHPRAQLPRARRRQRRGRDGGRLRAAARRRATAPCYGVGLDPNIVTATLRAVVSATNRAVERGWARLPHASRWRMPDRGGAPRSPSARTHAGVEHRIAAVAGEQAALPASVRVGDAELPTVAGRTERRADVGAADGGHDIRRSRRLSSGADRRGALGRNTIRAFAATIFKGGCGIKVRDIPGWKRRRRRR